MQDLINAIFTHIKRKYFSFGEVTYFPTMSPSLLSKNVKIKIKRNTILPVFDMNIKLGL